VTVSYTADNEKQVLINQYQSINLKQGAGC